MVKIRLRCHSVVILRGPRSAATEILPEAEAPRLVRGFALFELSFSRVIVGAARWLPASCAPTSDHLVLRVALERSGDGGAPHAYHTVREHRVRSWLRTKAGPPTERRAIALEDRPDGFLLTVGDGVRELCHLRAEPAACPGGAPGSSVFTSTRAASVQLGWPDGEVCALEALSVLELRCPWLDELPATLQLDSAFRAAHVRRDIARSPEPVDFSRVPAEPLAAPYLPSY